MYSSLLAAAVWLLLASAAVFGLAVLEVLTGWLPLSATMLYAISQQMLWLGYGVTAIALAVAVGRK